MNNKEEITKKMQSILQKELSIDSLAQDVNIQQQFTLTQDEKQWLKDNSIMNIKDGEFLGYFQPNENDRIIVCFKELNWYVRSEIQLECYRNSENSENIYYSGYPEWRNVLDKAILWIANLSNKTIKHNDGEIIKEITPEIASMFWGKYQTKDINIQEATALYDAAKLYFTNQADTKPIPPIIEEIDMMIKFCKISRQELKEISYSDMQRIKIVLKARAECLGLYGAATLADNTKPDVDFLTEQFKHTFPNARKNV